jgi:hypothetical protein
LVKKPARGVNACVVDQDSDARIIAKPALHQGEIASVGEVSLQDIDRNSGFPAETIAKLLHSGAIARD